MTELFLLLLCGILSNWILYFFLILGAIIGKKKMLFFALGVIVQAISYLGHLAGWMRRPELYPISTDYVFCVICFIAITIGFYVILKKSKRS